MSVGQVPSGGSGRPSLPASGGVTTLVFLAWAASLQSPPSQGPSLCVSLPLIIRTLVTGSRATPLRYELTSILNYLPQPHLQTRSRSEVLGLEGYHLIYYRTVIIIGEMAFKKALSALNFPQ